MDGLVVVALAASEFPRTGKGCTGFVVLGLAGSVELRAFSSFSFVVEAALFEPCCPGAVPIDFGCVVGVVVGTARVVLGANEFEGSAG